MEREIMRFLGFRSEKMLIWEYADGMTIHHRAFSILRDRIQTLMTFKRIGSLLDAKPAFITV